MSEPTEIRVMANGIEFGALEWAADRTGPLALMLHGYPDSAWSWRHLGPFLAERGYRAVAPFMRGYAPSGLAPDDSYLVSDLAADAVALHGALGGDDRAVLIGHDWGSCATWGVTIQAPERFRKYVAMSVPPPNSLLTPFTRMSTVPLGLRQLRMSWYMLYNQLPGISDRSLDTLIPRLWRDWSPGYDGAADAGRALVALDTPARRRAALRYYRNNLQGGAPKTLAMKGGAAALYLHGTGDACIQPGLAENFRPRLPAGSRLEFVDGTGHFLQLEDPDKVNALIADWIG